MDQEEIVNPVGLCGDLIKAFQHQAIPGIDQIFQYGRGVEDLQGRQFGGRQLRPAAGDDRVLRRHQDMPVANLYRRPWTSSPRAST